MSFKISVSAEIRLEIPYEIMILAKLTWNRVALIFYVEITIIGVLIY